MVKTRVSQEGVYVLRTLVGDPENTHGTAWGMHGPLVGIDSNIWGQQSAVTFQDSVWYVSCKSERDHYTQVHCMYVCVCVCVYKYDLHTPQHLDFFLYSVVSIHLHEDICLKLHLLDDLRLGTQTCHYPPLPRQMCPCSQSCQEWVCWLQDQANEVSGMP